MPSSQRVYVGNIGSDTRERDLEKFFKGFGKIGEIAVKNGYGFVNFDDHRDADDAVHDLDGKDLHGSRIRVQLARERRDRDDRDGGDRRGGGRDGGRGGGRYDDRGGGRRDDRHGGFSDRRGGRGGNPPGRKTEFRCVVENISAATSWQDLKDYFRTAGEVTYTNAHKPRDGEGIVEFGDKRGLEYAMKNLDDTELDGKRIKLVPPQGGGFGDRGGDRGGDREQRGSGGGSRRRLASRSRSRSRSNSRSRSPAEKKSRSRSRSKSERKSRSRSKS